jgi:Tol biopolymer transport system component
MWLLLSLLVFAQPERVATDVVSLGAPTRDGRFVTHVRNGNLALRDLKSGADRILTNKTAGSNEFAYFSVPSRDNAEIAYAWFNADGFYELRLIPLGGGIPRTLYRNPEAGFVQPCAFTTDNRKILTLLFRKDNTSQIVLISRETGTVETLRSLQWVYPKRMDLSSDGRYLVYDSFKAGSKSERAIYLLALDGSTETTLTPEAGSYLFPLFSPDDQSIYYFGGDADQLALWVRPRNGGQPKRVATNLGRALPLGITEEGMLLFGLRNGATDVYTIPIESKGNPERVTINFPGLNRSPAWSPDGTEIAYLSRRGAENFGQESRTILIRTLESKAERDLNPKLAYMDRILWTQHGLLISGSDGKGRGGVFLVDPKTGQTRPLEISHDAPFRGYPAALAPDQSLYTLRNGQLWKDARRIPDLDSLTALALAPDGKGLAVCSSKGVIQILFGPGNQEIQCPDCTELNWGRQLIAASRDRLIEVQLDNGSLREIATPGNREGVFSASPKGNRIALTVGQHRDEIWALALGLK